MNWHKGKIWFLLIYLGVLLNLGQSLHRSEFFGLHSHAGSDSEQVSHSCCHCHGHPPAHDNSGEGSRLDSHHDCAVCKFFEQYNTNVFQFELPEPDEFRQSVAFLKPCPAVREAADASARGPPAI